MAREDADRGRWVRVTVGDATTPAVMCGGTCATQISLDTYSHATLEMQEEAAALIAGLMFVPCGD